MESENTYMIIDGPDSSVVLRYIWNTASEEEKAQVDVWLKEDPEHEKCCCRLPVFIMLTKHANGLLRVTLYERIKSSKENASSCQKILLEKSFCLCCVFLLGLIISSVIYWKNKIMCTSLSGDNNSSKCRYAYPFGFA